MSTNVEIIKRYKRYQKDPLAFLEECVFTLDQVDQKDPIKKFPTHYEYLRFYVKLWMKYPLIAIPKSRRMTMSWVNIALYLWDTIFKEGRFNALVSKKEDDAKELVEKAKFIFEHIPEDKIPKNLLPKMKEKMQPPMLTFPELNSKLQGFPMGADQLRQFTFSGILGDEVAFWPEAQKFYAASLPTLEGGGRASFISSPAPGFFKKIVFDTVNNDVDLSQPPSSVTSPMQGIRVWVNPNNRFLVCEIHYTANPLKRNEEYRLSIEKSMPRREYLQEYELNWDSFDGLPVYGDFNRNIHLSEEPLEPQLGLPLLIGHDFGLTPSAVVGQMQGDQLVILREYVAKNKPTNIFIPEIMTDIQLRWPAWNDQDKHFRHFVDPSGNFRKDTDANTCVIEMQKAGLKNIIPGDITWEKRRGAVDHFLRKHTGQGPGIIMHEPDCPMLVKGFLGGYHYPESYGETEPSKLRPLKNEFSHVHDGLQYLCGGVKKQNRRMSKEIPTPKYGFTKGGTDRQKDTGASKYGYKKFQ